MVDFQESYLNVWLQNEVKKKSEMLFSLQSDRVGHMAILQT